MEYIINRTLKDFFREGLDIKYTAKIQDKKLVGYDITGAYHLGFRIEKDTEDYIGNWIHELSQITDLSVDNLDKDLQATITKDAVNYFVNKTRELLQNVR
jgi:hypothetical protein